MKDLLTIILVAFALSMDAFAVSLSFGTRVKDKFTIALKAGIFFGVFQALMPLLGWALGSLIKNFIQQFGHWIVFALLSIIGLRMMFEAIRYKKSKRRFNTESLWVMFSLSIATSIDAFVVGLSFALIRIPIIIAISAFGIVTFWMSYTGVYIGRKLKHKLGNKAEILGGLILLGMGIKVLLEHFYNNY